ncbi:MAG: AbrB/MazE/SpoVT family DNA-binding domain-containing protein [Methylococcales bacterium]
MPKVSAKRQITIPIDQCEALGIEPGDKVDMFVVDGQLTLVKKTTGAAKGLLSHLNPNNSMTDDESLQGVMCDRN